MQGEPARWIMTAKGEPLVPGSNEVAVEVSGYDNRVLAAAHVGEIKGRAIFVPSQQGAQ